MKVSYETQHAVADRVAKAWRRKGIRSYSYEDIYQDAVVTIHQAAKNYDPEKGNIEPFLHRACVHRLCDSITKAVHLPSTRSKDEIQNLRETTTFEWKHDERSQGTSGEELDDFLWVKQVRERMEQLAAELPDGDIALRVTLGLTTVREAAADKEHAKKLHYTVRRLRGLMGKDYTLYRIAREQHG